MYNPADYSNNPELNLDIFRLFDLDGSGKIDIKDLEDIGKAMGWKK
jgi:Ca2+-binding EF-hand superfamily protein